ncbi:hypothetical protein AVEN_18069-1 [Araneus ventricosus]|uniref:Uncharacterized protein n=1 Tax=Araneus ventricosus TaxID=182803 RepID=A0A4Y2UGN7_ARAVE|nr:hypothetical protein AVEN_18069-1 [Araneus ventricosus]
MLSEAELPSFIPLEVVNGAEGSQVLLPQHLIGQHRSLFHSLTWMNMMVQMGLELPPQLPIPLDEPRTCSLLILSPLYHENSFLRAWMNMMVPNGIGTATASYTTR